jgi:hypothetical protein
VGHGAGHPLRGRLPALGSSGARALRRRRPTWPLWSSACPCGAAQRLLNHRGGAAVGRPDRGRSSSVVGELRRTMVDCGAPGPKSDPGGPTVLPKCRSATPKQHTCRRRDPAGRRGNPIEQRAGDRRDRDALMASGVLGIEGTRAVQADPRGAVAAAQGGDVDACLVGVQQAPVRSGAHVAEHRPRPAREHRGQPPPLAPEARVPERVDTLVNAMQSTPLHPRINHRSGRTERKQLRASHHSPLPPRQPRHRQPLGWARFPDTMSAFRAHPPRVPAR